MADVLLGWLLKAQTALDSLTQQQQDALSYRMPAPKHSEAKHMFNTRCFGVSFEQVCRLDWICQPGAYGQSLHCLPKRMSNAC